MEGLGIANGTREAMLNEKRAHLVSLLHRQIGFQLRVKRTFDLAAHNGNKLAVILGHQLVLVVFEILKFLIQHGSRYHTELSVGQSSNFGPSAKAKYNHFIGSCDASPKSLPPAVLAVVLGAVEVQPFSGEPAHDTAVNFAGVGIRHEVFHDQIPRVTVGAVVRHRAEVPDLRAALRPSRGGSLGHSQSPSPPQACRRWRPRPRG